MAKGKEGKFRYGWVVLSTIAVIILVFGSFVSSLLIYLTLLLLGALVIRNMIMIENIYIKAKPAEEPIEESEEIVEPQPPINQPVAEPITPEPQPTQQPQQTEEETRMQKVAETLMDYIVTNHKRGHKLELIREALIKKYHYGFVDDLINMAKQQKLIEVPEEKEIELPAIGETITTKRRGRPKK